MRIGFDAKRAFTNNTGLGNYSRDTIRLLSNYYLDNEYFLFTPKYINNKRLDFLNMKKNIHIKTPKSLINQTFSSYWRSKSIVQDLIENKIDIFHGLTHEIPIGIEKTNIKSIVTIHDLIFIRFPKYFNYIDRIIYFNKFKSSCERADKIIAISNQTKKDIINYFSIKENKIEVVYQGCNPIFQNHIITNYHLLKKYNLPNKFLLYVGNIEERKNLLTLLQVIHKLKNQHLVIIGNGKSYKTKCLNYILKNKLKKRVTVLSNLKIEEIAVIYKLANIMIYPSVFEGFGIPIIEALFTKTPVITSKDGCFSEAGGPNTKYINPLSVLEIKNAILEIQNSKELQKKMRSEGYKHAKNFTEKKIGENLMKIYNE